jgi:putative ABC transport system ATP-binding protein
VSLSLNKGELLALYGPSGSGKTTLLLIAAALLTPDSGSVIVNGRDLSSLSEKEASSYRLQEIGLVRQSFNLLAGASTIDNAALKLFGTGASKTAAHRRVAPLLQRLGLEGRLDHRGRQLSMGERQRVMIARALSTEPSLVLADEPTGSLDSERGREVLGLLCELCRERELTVLLVTHDAQAAKFADRVCALRDGRLVEYEPDLTLAATDAR